MAHPSWCKLLQPDLVLGDTILSLSPEIIQQHHLKGLVLDVDETLIPFNASRATVELRQWFDTLRPSVDCWLVSNNLSDARIRRIAKFLDVPYLAGAGKPSRRKLRRAVQAMDLPVEHVAMVGDRLFTDVLAGNRLGMFTILVEPMVIPAGAVRHSPLRTAEVWLSQLMGVSLSLEP